MPMIGHLSEAGVIIHNDFPEDNIAPKGNVIGRVYLDSAGYQSDIFNYLEETGKTFAIGGGLDHRRNRSSPGCLKHPGNSIPTAW
jgi:hypothetical protein